MLYNQYIIKDHTIKVMGFEREKDVYEFGHWEPKLASRYKALLAIKKDIEYAEAYLNQMFFNEDTTLIDGALINYSIQLLVKCFSNPSGAGRLNLDSKKVFRNFAISIGEEDLTESFSQFYNARNKYISHDEYDFYANLVGITVNRATGLAEDIAELTIRTKYLYKQNQKLLLKMTHVLLKYLDQQIEGLRKYLIDKYNQEKPDLELIVCENYSLTNAW